MNINGKFVKSRRYQIMKNGHVRGRVDTMNLYWSVYENLESEVLALANSIMFDDSQLKVYSLKIGDLIVRCAVEIESISKELYLQEGGKILKRDLYFDTDCLDLLVKKWNIDKKKLHVSSSKMDFSSSNLILTPLEKSNQRGKCQWKKAYQAIKHNRAISLKQANIRNLLNVLGALYILNLYYRNESFWCNIPINDKSPYMNPSKIFTPYICDLSESWYWLLDSENIDALKTTDWISPIESSMEESVYIKRYTDNSIHQQRKWLIILILNGNADGTLKKIFPMQNEFSAENIIEEVKNGRCLDIAKTVYKARTMFEQTEWIKFEDMNKTTEIIINKNLTIYPEKTWKDFLESDDFQNILKYFKNRVMKN